MELELALSSLSWGILECTKAERSCILLLLRNNFSSISISKMHISDILLFPRFKVLILYSSLLLYKLPIESI